jgi:hypothetical protein
MAELSELIEEGRALLETRPIKLSSPVVGSLVKRLMDQFEPPLRSLARTSPVAPLGNKVWGTETITVSDVKGKKRKIPVSIVSVQQRGVKGLFLGAVYVPRQRIIQVTMNGNLGAGDIVPLLRGTEMSSVQGAMKSALMHEITHAKDMLRKRHLEQAIAAILQRENPLRPFSDKEVSKLLKTAGFEVSFRLVARKRKELGLGHSTQRLKGSLSKAGLIPPLSSKKKKKRSQDKMKRYYNQPEEVKAYMQQIADHVQDIAPAHRAKLVAWGTSRAVTFLLKQSNTWNEIQKYLTPKNRKKIKKGVVTVLQDMGAV